MTLSMSRRGLLTAASLSAGVTVLAVSPAALAATADTGLSLTPVGDRPLPVRTPDAAPRTTCPQQLAVRIVNTGASVPAGAQVEFAYDARLYAATEPVVAGPGGRRVDATAATATDPKTGVTTCRVTVREPIPAAAQLVVLAGTAHPLRFPYDLVRRPGDTAATLVAGTRTRHDLRRPAGTGSARTPWGIELTGGWAAQTWGDGHRFRYYRPVGLRLRGTGPGKAPDPVSFAVAVDPRLVTAVTAGTATLNGKPAGRVRRGAVTRTAAVHETRWTTTVRLGAGDVLDVVLHTTTRTPDGPLPTIKHPAVELTMPGDDAQRTTGRETLTRYDAVWE